MTLHCQGVKRKGFFTNAHVIKPSSTAEENVRKKADQEGTSYTDVTFDIIDSKVRFFVEKDIEAIVGRANW